MLKISSVLFAENEVSGVAAMEGSQSASSDNVQIVTVVSSSTESVIDDVTGDSLSNKTGAVGKSTTDGEEQFGSNSNLIQQLFMYYLKFLV